MRIGIDARFYGSRAKGLGRYTQKLIEYLQDVDHDNDYVIFLQSENFDSFVIRNPRFTKVLANYKWYTFSEQVMMPWVLWRQKLDFVHFPHFNVPLFFRGRFVVTIHDLIITHFPTIRASTLSPWLYKIKQFGYHVVIRHAVKRSLKVVTISQYTKDEILSYFKVPDSHVQVIYEGVEKKNVPLTPSQQEEIVKRFSVYKPFVLYVGTAYPHKNLEVLLDVMEKVAEKRPDLKLVLVGKIDYFYERLQQEVKRKNFSDRIIFVGEVTDQELYTLYREALLYVFPSLCEGFGLPPLEALSQGLPVVSSKLSCLPEILGDAAIFFDPKNVSEISEDIVRVASDEQLRASMRAKGLEHVKKYSWEDMARKTRQVYHEFSK